MTTTPRQKKTDRQRAEETLATAQRRVDRLDKAAKAARTTWDDLRLELGDATARLDYARQDPALQNTTTTNEETA